MTSFEYLMRVGDLPAQPVSGGQVRFDDSRAPHITGTVTVPYSAPLVDKADPRRSPVARCELTVKQTTSAGLRTFVLDLAIRDRAAAHRANTLTLEVASDEALLDDYAPLDDVHTVVNAPRIRDVVVFVLNRAIPGAGARLLPGVNPESVGPDADPEALVWRAGVTALAFLAPLVQALGLRLVCDERRNWTLRPDFYALEGGEPIMQLTVGENLIDGEDRISRDDGLWFDAALCRYRWVAADGTEHEQHDRYWLVPEYTRLREFVKDARYPGAGFAKYAVERAQARGREVSATAVAQWHIRPELFGQIRLPNTPLQMGNVRSVNFVFDTDAMHVTSHTIDTPESAYILAPDGYRYLDFPPDMQIQNIDWSL